MSPPVMVSSPKALLKRDLDIFEANHFTIILEIPQTVVTLPEPILR